MEGKYGGAIGIFYHATDQKQVLSSKKARLGTSHILQRKIPKIGFDISKIGVENLLFQNVILYQDKLRLAVNTGFSTFPPDNTMIIEPSQSLRNLRS